MKRFLTVILTLILALMPAMASMQSGSDIDLGSVTDASTVDEPALYFDSDGNLSLWMQVLDVEIFPEMSSTPATPVDTDTSEKERVNLTVAFGGIDDSQSIKPPTLLDHYGAGNKIVEVHDEGQQTHPINGELREGIVLNLEYEIQADAVLMDLSWRQQDLVTMMIDLRSEDPSYSTDLMSYLAHDQEGTAYKYYFRKFESPIASMRIASFAFAGAPADPLRGQNLRDFNYVILTMEVTNLSDEPLDLRADEFYLWTTSGATFVPKHPRLQGDSSPYQNDISSKQIDPGESGRITLYIPYISDTEPTDIMWYMKSTWTVVPLN